MLTGPGSPWCLGKPSSKQLAPGYSRPPAAFYDMKAAFMSYQPHESGIHAIWLGAGEASVTEVRFRCVLRPATRRE